MSEDPRQPASTTGQTGAEDEGIALSRRNLLPILGAGALAGWAGLRLERSGNRPDWTSAVTIVKAARYSDDLAHRMLEGVKQCGLDVRGKRVLLKPNMVEFDRNTCINTDVSIVAAALEVFHQLGAAEVRIGEGPGHRRDTYDLAELARYRTEIPKFDDIFTDLNRDDVTALQGNPELGEIYLPNTALRADLIVSLAKMKTHHWAGATLSMKNYFGLVPGCIYGWPKNHLHHLKIERSIVGLNRIFGRRSFAIVDGIVGMEGNGPIQGTPKPAGVMVMGSDLLAVDATCCRIMGIDPERVAYLKLAGPLGNIEEERIEQRGEKIASVHTKFALLKKFDLIRLES
ncbi:MAG: DUF362 domain-containing protein [Bryobacteraceae bacterium]